VSRPRTPSLNTLSPQERAAVLSALLHAHPELVAEAETLARDLLETGGRGEVAQDVADELRALTLRDLAERSGRHWGGGYVDPQEAAYQILTATIQPYLDDLRRRAKSGATCAALEIGLGLLAGLYACREEKDDDLLLAHAPTPDAIDDLAAHVLQVIVQAGLQIPDGWPEEMCPAWMRLVHMTGPGHSSR
jgi:hypothetical protein